MSSVATTTTYFEEQLSEQHIRQRSSKNFENEKPKMIQLYNRRKISFRKVTWTVQSHQVLRKIQLKPMSTLQKTNDNKQILKIDVTSDNICPWCYIGKRRLEKALSQIDTSNINVSISWYPFELDHGLPRDGSLLKMDRYKQKFGETRTKQMLPAMLETGKQEGIHFSYGGKIGSTFDSHRLLYYVKQLENGEKKQNDLINVLFRNYFEEEQDLSDHQVLIKAAEQIGLNPNEIKQFLQSDQYKKEVQQEINRNYQEGISGVPHFRINDNIELSGAQDPQQFIQAFRKVGLPV